MTIGIALQPRPEISSNMKLVRLGDHVEILSGFAFDSSRFATDGEMPLIRIRDVVRGRTETYYSGSFDERFVVRKGDLLIGMDGDFNREIWSSEPALLNQRVCRVSPLGDDLDCRYLYHFLPQALMKIWHATPFATVKHLSVKAIREIALPLPPLDEQRRIAAILDKADELRTKRRQALTHLDILTQSIFFSMFGDPARTPHKFPKREVVDLCTAQDDIRCGPFGTQLNKDEFRSTGVPLWGIKHVNKSFSLPTHEFLEPATAKRLDSYSILPGDIVMTRKGTVGNCSVYPENFPAGIMHSDLLRLRIDPNTANVRFISDQLHSSRDVSHQVSLISGGAIMAGINVSKLKTIKVLAPPLADQNEYATRVSAVDRLKNRYRAQLAELDTLCASLQHRAFEGEL